MAFRKKTKAWKSIIRWIAVLTGIATILVGIQSLFQGEEEPKNQTFGNNSNIIENVEGDLEINYNPVSENTENDSINAVKK